MTSYTSSTIDDQQERHYIGNLLYDDDPFSPPTKRQCSSMFTNCAGTSVPTAHFKFHHFTVSHFLSFFRKLTSFHNNLFIAFL